MLLAGGAMLILALGYLGMAVVFSKFGNKKGPAEPKHDRALHRVRD